MAEHLIAWAHTGCTCHLDADPAFFHSCDLHFNAEKLKAGCLLAYSHVTDQTTREYLRAVLERVGVPVDG